MVKCTFEILAATSNTAALVERDGLKQIASHTLPTQLIPSSVRVALGEPIATATRHVDMAGCTLAELPRPDALRVLYYGYVTPVRFTSISLWENRFNPVSIQLDKLKLEHAEYRDILELGLQHALIREGTVIVKIQRLASGDSSPPSPAASPNPTPQAGLRMVELRLRPDDEILNAVNLRLGYPLLEIRSPLEVWKDDGEEI